MGPSENRALCDCGGHKPVDLKQTLSVIYVARMVLFWINKELQSGVYTRGEPCVSPLKQGEENFCKVGGGGTWEGYNKQRVHWRN